MLYSGPSQEAIDAVARMQDYISGHLTQPITLKQLSGAANYSPYYSAHIFKEMIGLPPFEYISCVCQNQPCSFVIKSKRYWMSRLTLCLTLTRGLQELFRVSSA